MSSICYLFTFYGLRLVHIPGIERFLGQSKKVIEPTLSTAITCIFIECSLIY